MIFILELIKGIIISVISVYTPQCDLDDKQEDSFYNSLISNAGKLGGRVVLVITEDFNDHMEVIIES